MGFVRRSGNIMTLGATGTSYYSTACC